MAQTAQKKQAPKTVFVVGSDPYYMDLIGQIPEAKSWKILSALEWSETTQQDGRFDFDDLYDKARATIDEAGGEPDAIISYLDFPFSCLASLLTRDYGLTGASPEAVAKCEHKFWMRQAQKKAFPDTTPNVVAINPFDPEQARKDAPRFPFWLKPVKGHSSILGFLVENEDALDRALSESRKRIHAMGQPFNQFLAHLDGDRPDDVDGNYMVAEEMIAASRQFTLEGFVWKGNVEIYGAIDSVREGRQKSSFSRYQYPGDLPEEIVSEGADIAGRVLKEIGYDNAPFNVEFFWEPESGALNLLEINARISKSHSPLFHMVDGASNQKVAVELSLGLKPRMPRRKGKDTMAAKFMLRSFEPDGIVRNIPTSDEIGELERLLPDIHVSVFVEKGTKLSSMLHQDSYSYELAEVFLGGPGPEMLEDAYWRSLRSLPIHIQPFPAEA
jgi:hypothetical protein